jgi:general L-amino acid transport system substrate-binding protein
MHLVRIFGMVAALCGFMLAAADAGTLDDVKKRGVIHCGVSQGNPGFSSADAQGKWTGFDVDLCRAISAAIFGSPDKVKYTALSAKERFTALQSGEIDVLSRTTTWTLVRDSALGLNFAGVNYYDGQGFMVPKKLNVKTAKDLNGASVCVAIGTTTELNLADYFRAKGMTYKPVVFEKADEVRGAYDAGRCDVFTTDRSSLATQRTLLKNPEDHLVLPEIISKEPLGPVVRHGDDQWFDLVKWVLYAMLEAEEYGVSSENVDQLKTNAKDPVVRRLLGLEGDMGKNLGLGNEWAYNIVKTVGNYGESYERHLGPKTPIKLERGANALWKDGGLQYPMPVR